jgi:hypothetical protein
MTFPTIHMTTIRPPVQFGVSDDGSTTITAPPGSGEPPVCVKQDDGTYVISLSPGTDVTFPPDVSVEGTINGVSARFPIASSTTVTFPGGGRVAFPPPGSRVTGGPWPSLRLDIRGVGARIVRVSMTPLPASQRAVAV